MNKHANFRKLAGVALAAASLLALAPMGVASAADASISIPTTGGKETITVNGTNMASISGHTFKAVRIGTYTSATGDSTTKTISAVSVGTVADSTGSKIATASDKALKAVSDYKANTAYNNNPVGQVAAEYLGYTPATANGDNKDTTSNTVPFSGGLREFVTNLAGDADFTAALNASSVKSVKASATSAQFTGLLPGIYMVEDTSAGLGKDSIPMLVSTGITAGSPAVTYDVIDGQTLGAVNMKADTPSVKKALDTAAGVVNIPGVGGKLHYKLASTVPMTTGYKRYLFTMVDTPAGANGAAAPGLALDEGSVVVTVGGKTLAVGTDYTVTNTTYTDDAAGMNYSGENDTKFVVFDLSPSIVSQTYNAPITITYAMNVTDNAQSAGFSNGVHLAYSNDSNHQPAPSDPNDPNSPAAATVDANGTVTDGTDGSNGNGAVTSVGGDESSQVVKSYQRSFNLHVVNKTDESQGLAGAQFQIKDASTGKVLKFLKVTDGSYKLAANQADAAPATKAAVVPTSTDTLDVTAKGELKVDGLADAKYTVVQTREGTGFAHSFLPTFSVTTSGSKSDTSKSVYANGADATWGLVDATATGTTMPVDTAILVRNVKSVSQLPLTGGAGVILFVVLAVLLLAVAASLYALKRRNAQSMKTGAVMRV